MHAKRNGYSFSYREVNFFRGSMDLLFEELQKANKNKKQTVVLSGSFENAKKMSKLLDEKNIKYILDEKLEDFYLISNAFPLDFDPEKIFSIVFMVKNEKIYYEKRN